jgi:integral membrane protein
MTPERRFAWAAYAEGASFLLLLGVAMPLKYLAGQPLAVRYVGMIHGLLWLALVVVLVIVAWRLRWSLARGIAVFVSSLLPFGFLVVDRRMRTWGAQPPPG